jgi:hypothetical protein
MRLHLLLLLAIACPACQQARQISSSLSSGTRYVSRPIVSGSKKLASATASGSRAVANATVSGSRKVAAATVSGAKALAAGATRLITFGSATRPAPPAPLAPPKDNSPVLPAAHAFPTSGLLVTENELGPDATRLQATAVNLAGGWVLNGSDLAYRLPPGADDPSALRVKGSPATATLTPEDTTTTTASAREIHYHSANQVLILRGSATLASAGTTITGTSSSTSIKIHLPTGAIAIDGPARWGSGL